LTPHVQTSAFECRALFQPIESSAETKDFWFLIRKNSSIGLSASGTTSSAQPCFRLAGTQERKYIYKKPIGNKNETKH
jgi:hypothetical protein